MKLNALKYLILAFLCLGAQAKEVRIAFTKSMPPYLYENDNRGIELEIIRAAFKSQGVILAPYDNIHYIRASKLLKRKRIDAVVSNLSNKSYNNKETEIFDSISTLSYMDCAISLKDKQLNYKDSDVFKDNTIWAFKSAKEVLGPAFKKAVLQNPNYTENYEQKNMIHMLVKKRVDIVISDRNIFTKTMMDSIGKRPDLFRFEKLIPETPRNLKFHNKGLRDIFNKGLIKIKKNGVYKEIMKKYKDLYKSEC